MGKHLYRVTQELCDLLNEKIQGDYVFLDKDLECMGIEPIQRLEEEKADRINVLSAEILRIF